MAELRCSDGTIVQISKETEAEFRKMFKSKPTFRLGDIFWRDAHSLNGCNYLQLVEKDGRVGLYPILDTYRNPVYNTIWVQNINAITLDEVCRMTAFSDGLRLAGKLTITEEDDDV